MIVTNANTPSGTRALESADLAEPFGITADTAPEVQATRRARATSPAPIAMPTIGTAATPSRSSPNCRKARRTP